VLELLRPPPHRGPLIAAGAVVLAAGLVLGMLRLGDDLSPVVGLLIFAAAAGLNLGLGLQAPSEEGRPPAYQSVLLVTGLLLLWLAFWWLADVLGADSLTPGTVTWSGLLVAGASAFAALRARSAICLLIGVIALGVALVAAIEWIFEPDSFTASRWLLLVLATGLVIGSLVLRAGAPRHSQLLIVGAGLAILAIALQALVVTLFGSVFFSGGSSEILPGFWELVVLASAFGLLAYSAVDRAPGPAWLGATNLAAFIASAWASDDQTLYWWPLLLVVLGTVALIAGLRPRTPLPPEPDGYRMGEQPRAARASDDDELVLRVRDDSSPR
jgi:hypothetical protein